MPIAPPDSPYLPEEVAFLIDYSSIRNKNDLAQGLKQALAPYHNGLNKITAETKLCILYSVNEHNLKLQAKQIEDLSINEELFPEFRVIFGQSIKNKYLQNIIVSESGVLEPFTNPSVSVPEARLELFGSVADYNELTGNQKEVSMYGNIADLYGTQATDFFTIGNKYFRKNIPNSRYSYRVIGTTLTDVTKSFVLKRNGYSSDILLTDDAAVLASADTTLDQYDTLQLAASEIATALRKEYYNMLFMSDSSNNLQFIENIEISNLKNDSNFYTTALDVHTQLFEDLLAKEGTQFVSNTQKQIFYVEPPAPPPS